MALSALAYIITGAAMAWFLGVRKPLIFVVCALLWPAIAALVLTYSALDWEA